MQVMVQRTLRCYALVFAKSCFIQYVWCISRNHSQNDCADICIIAPDSLLRSPDSLCPIAVAAVSESKAIYTDFIKMIKDVGGWKGQQFKTSLCDALVTRVILSCDAKAAQLIFGCNRANAPSNFCPYGCVVDKITYAV